MLASINEKGNRKNYVNDNSNTKNLVKLPWKPVTGPKWTKELKNTQYEVVFMYAAT